MCFLSDLGKHFFRLSDALCAYLLDLAGFFNPLLYVKPFLNLHLCCGARSRLKLSGKAVESKENNGKA